MMIEGERSKVALLVLLGLQPQGVSPWELMLCSERGEPSFGENVGRLSSLIASLERDGLVKWGTTTSRIQAVSASTRSAWLLPCESGGKELDVGLLLTDVGDEFVEQVSFLQNAALVVESARDLVARAQVESASTELRARLQSSLSIVEWLDLRCIVLAISAYSGTIVMPDADRLYATLSELLVSQDFVAYDWRDASDGAGLSPVRGQAALTELLLGEGLTLNSSVVISSS